LVVMRVFVDESYGPDDYYVAGVVVTDVQYSRMVDAIAVIRERAAATFGVPVDVEFHAHRLMQARPPWSCMNGQLHEAVALYRAFLRAVVASGATVMIEGVDVRRLRARYRYPDSPYEVTLRHLLERVDVLARENGNVCAVTADLIDRHDDFAEAIAGYTRVGTPGFRPSRLERVVGPVWVDSCSEVGVQAADMVAYIVRRNREVVGSPRARRATRSLVHQLRPAISHERKWIP
jgi:hypothetical protein